MNRFILQISQY